MVRSPILAMKLYSDQAFYKTELKAASFTPSVRSDWQDSSGNDAFLDTYTHRFGETQLHPWWPSFLGCDTNLGKTG